MAAVIAYLDWSLMVECPACKQDNDLNTGTHDSENHIASKIFNNQWDKLQGHEVTCEHCFHAFTISKVEY